MDEPLYYDISFSAEGMDYLKLFIDRTLNNWPGGDPYEQLFLQELQQHLRKHSLERTLMLDVPDK